MGFALETIGDRVTARFTDVPGVRITNMRGKGEGIPLDPALNTAGPPVRALTEQWGGERGVELEIHKGFYPGSGLGSSAASAAAAAVACNELLGMGLSRRELLEFAMKGEEVASGAWHADNVAPSMLGGFILVRGYDPLDVVRLEPPETLRCAVVHPHAGIATKTSRQLLPTDVPLRDVVKQTGNAAGLVAGLLTGDTELIGRSLDDVIAEPCRACTIPGFQEVKQAALEAGALGCSISGSGPALFALTADQPTAERVAKAMGQVAKKLEIAHDVYVSRINPAGTVIVP
jgi:homoserine kinase